jgi:hypothetical protein
MNWMTVSIVEVVLICWLAWKLIVSRFMVKKLAEEYVKLVAKRDMIRMAVGAHDLATLAKITKDWEINEEFAAHAR